MGFDGDSMGILYSYIEPLGEFLEMGDAQFTMGVQKSWSWSSIPQKHPNEAGNGHFFSRQ